MAAALYLISRSHVKSEVVNGVFAVLINVDTAVDTTDALKIARAVKVCNAMNPTEAQIAPEIAVGSNVPVLFGKSYFDVVQPIGDLSAGPLSAANTSVVLGGVAYPTVSPVQPAAT